MAVILAALYLIGLVIGLYSVIATPYQRQKEAFSVHAKIIGEEFIAGKEYEINRTRGANTYILFFDAEGTRVRLISPNNIPGAEPGVTLDKKLSSVLSGEEIVTLSLARATQRELSDIIILVGAPITQDGAVVGAVFIIKNMMDLPEAAAGLMLFFTLTYWLAALLIVSNIRKTKKLEALKRNYIMNVTHELKAPVASIKALAETLCDGVEPDSDNRGL
jgi:signal transduction histidine kinase